MITAPSPTHSTGPTPELNKPFIWAISLVAALGGLLFGYDWVVIGGAKPFYEKFFGISADVSLQGWAMGCALLGCLVGALGSGSLSDRFGRKGLLLVSAILFAISSLGTGLANSFSVFVAWRIIGGVAIGLASSLSPMYIAEIAPPALRGRLVTMNQLTIVIGILLAQIINYQIADAVPKTFTEAQILASWNGQTGWRWMFGVTAIPSFLFFAGMFFVPESPRWQAKAGNRDAARKVLARIGGESYADEALAEIEGSFAGEEEKTDWREIFNPKYLRVLGLGIFLAVFQQWCGINVIFNYAEEIFRQAGYDITDVLKNIAWTGSVNLVFTFVAVGMVDRWGRRGLMLMGSLGLAIIYVAIGFCYHLGIQGTPLLGLVLAAIAFYSMSLAPIVWVVISEIFPNRIRGTAMSVAVGALWIACFILTYTFPLLNKAYGPAGTFWLYAGICVLGFFFVARLLPETKGKSLEQIERELTGKA